MDDVVVAGGGPAGALAALILARAGLRVRVFDRAQFPRFKLCGDTLNPGAIRVLRKHADVRELAERALVIEGMCLTGPHKVGVRGRYGEHVTGLAITRYDFDAWLISQARSAGAIVEEQTRVAGAIIDPQSGAVTGVSVDAPARATRRCQARLVIGADGRRSRLAFASGLARQPLHPRRWAIGAYFENVAGLTRLGEMHVRPTHYLGVAPLPGGLANACLVMPRQRSPTDWRGASERLMSAIAGDAVLRDRFGDARMIGRPAMLGPMAVDVTAPGVPGLLLAGDAAGFIDPMTGDGLRLGLEGAALAAETALAVMNGRLEIADSVEHLARARRAAFAGKWRFNRTVRSLVGSRVALSSAEAAARVVPSLFETMVRYAGDC